MLRTLFLPLAIVLTPATAPAGPDPSPGLRVAWSIAPADAAQVQLTLETRDKGSETHVSDTVDRSDLAGLDPALLAGLRASDVAFAIRRDAGRLDCSGVAARSRGTGTCRFTPDRAFAAALARRGVSRPSAGEAFQLAVQHVTLGLVDELQRQGYRPTINGLVAAGIHGVDAPYVRDLAAAGHRGGAIETLVAFRIHGVTPGWIGDLARLGYRGLTPEQLIAMRIHGVTPAFVRQVQASGARPAPDDLVAMRILGPGSRPGR